MTAPLQIFANSNELFDLGSRTEPEPLKLCASEPEPIIFREHTPEQKSFSNNV